MTLRELELKIAAGTATEADFSAFSREDVLRIKSELPVLFRAAAPLGVNDVVDVASIVVPANPEERVIELVANVQLVDRMGDLIVSNPADAEKFGGTGWELTHFMAAGGPYLWSHDPGLPAVGKVVETAVKRVPCDVEGEGQVRAWALVCRVQFFADARFGDLAIPAYLLTRAGITASSVGFLAKVFHRIDDEKERSKLGLGPWGAVLPRNELLELSKAQVPANPWSVGTGKAAGEADRRIVETLKRWVDQGTLAESLAGDFVKQFPLGERDAADRLAAKVRGFVPAATAARGKACEGLECLVAPEPVRIAIDTDKLAAADRARRTLDERAAKADCGCGAKTMQAELDGLRAERALLRELAGASDVSLDSPGADSALLRAVNAAIHRADDEVPARSMKRIRRALERASEAVEDLAIVVDDEAGQEDGGQKSPVLPSELAVVPASMADDLSAVLADPGLTGLVANMLRALVGKPLGGGKAPPIAAVAHGAAGSDAGPAVAALQGLRQEIAQAAS